MQVKIIIQTLMLCVCLTLLNTASLAKRNKIVIVKTNIGKFKLELYQDVPKHADNFIKLVEQGFYDSLLFHRVIPKFMIQGGDPDSKYAGIHDTLGNGDLSYKIDSEFKLPTYYHRKGALAAARDDNPEMSSSACQFYVVVGKIFTDDDLDKLEVKKGIKYSLDMRNTYKTIGGTPHLDGSYTVFGQCIRGQNIIDAISNVARDKYDRPLENIRIIKIKIKRRWI